MSHCVLAGVLLISRLPLSERPPRGWWVHLTFAVNMLEAAGGISVTVKTRRRCSEGTGCDLPLSVLQAAMQSVYCPYIKFCSIGALWQCASLERPRQILHKSVI